MKVFTILGIICQKKANYYHGENLNSFFSLKNDNYTNMFMLLLENFDKVIAIYTSKAKKIQENVLQNENLNYKFNLKYKIADENDFDATFKIINEAINLQDEKIIVDLSHGFRHLPILAIIVLISQNIQNSNKIKHIFFSKEIIKSQKYEIIDLKEFLDIANLSFMLENFNQNYTLTRIDFLNQNYNILADGLENLSHNILSNSIQNLYAKNLLKNTLASLKIVSKNELFNSFTPNINKAIKYISYLLSLEKKSSHIRLFEISKDLFKKGYILNSTTILYESAGIYAVNLLSNVSKTIKENIKFFKKSKIKNKDYLLLNFCFNFVKNGCLNRKNKNFNKVMSSMYDKEIKEFLKGVKNYKNIKNLYDELDIFRNNIAHANSGEIIKNPYKKLNDLLFIFEKFIIK